MELIPGLLTHGVFVGRGAGGILRIQAQEQALLDESGVCDAAGAVGVGGLGGQGGLCQLIVVEQIGKVAAMEHQLEGAIDNGLIDGLEDAVEELDGGGGVAQVVRGGEGLGGGGVVGVEADGG